MVRLVAVVSPGLVWWSGASGQPREGEGLVGDEGVVYPLSRTSVPPGAYGHLVLGANVSGATPA